jgi:hypothetical protein
MKRLGFSSIIMSICFVAGLSVVEVWSFVQSSLKNRISPANITQCMKSFSKLANAQPVLSESRIRRIDFLNFIYPNRSSTYRSIQGTIKLVNGEFEFYNQKERFQWLVSAGQKNIIYADLTGDGEEEAIIEMFSHSGAAGGEHFIYVYTMAGNQTKLLWFFETYGSGTDVGGIKAMYVQDSDLILELYGKNEVTEKGATVDEIAQNYMCDTCYKEFTRVRFHWNGKRFEQQGKAEVYSLIDKQN